VIVTDVTNGSPSHHSATHCNNIHTYTYSNMIVTDVTNGSPSQHTSTHCNTLHHTYIHILECDSHGRHERQPIPTQLTNLRLLRATRVRRICCTALCALYPPPPPLLAPTYVVCVCVCVCMCVCVFVCVCECVCVRCHMCTDSSSSST